MSSYSPNGTRRSKRHQPFHRTHKSDVTMHSVVNTPAKFPVTPAQKNALTRSAESATKSAARKAAIAKAAVPIKRNAYTPRRAHAAKTLAAFRNETRRELLKAALAPHRRTRYHQLRKTRAAYKRRASRARDRVDIKVKERVGAERKRLGLRSYTRTKKRHSRADMGLKALFISP